LKAANERSTAIQILWAAGSDCRGVAHHRCRLKTPQLQRLAPLPLHPFQPRQHEETSSGCAAHKSWLRLQPSLPWRQQRRRWS
jgi:hypothetical protein